ncbi:DNA internalization-related competence protein ComEC/Rec2 [bacterium]|nr:DNA internalization-related competence protein ComEC/Rec2 [bacterium]
MEKNFLNELFQNKNTIMFSTTLIYILGLYAYFTKMPLIFSGIITVSALFLIFKRLISVKLILFWIFIFYAGFLNCVLQIKDIDNLSIYSPCRCTINGEIRSIPKLNDYNTKFYFYVKSLNLNGKEIPNINSNVFVSVKNESPFVNSLQIRNSYSIDGLLRPPFKASNPSQFDYADYLKNFNTHNTFYASSNDIKLLNSNNNLLSKGVIGLNNLRNRIIATHSKYLKFPATEVLGGIVFGDDAVSPPDFIKNSFINSGLLHILAASGMNVAFIYGFWYFILTKLKIPFKLILISGIFMIILYSLMTGLGASVIRAAAMLIFILIGKLIDRDTHSVALLAMVAFIMLLYQPAYINNISFQLSFIVTFGLLVSFDLSSMFSNKFVKWVVSSITIPIIAQIWVIPLQMFYFNTISIYSVFANILTVPFLSVVSFLGFLSSVLSIIQPISDFVCKYTDFIVLPCINAIIRISDYFGSFSNSIMITTHPNVFQILIYYIIILLCILNIKLKFKNKKAIIAIIALLILLPLTCINIPSKNMELIAFDVQNADAFLIKSPKNKYFMIDTGKSGYNGGNSQALTIIIKYMKDKGIKNLEGLIITHFDNDHSGGAPDILDYAKINTVYINGVDDNTFTSKEIFKRLKNKNVKIAQNNDIVYQEDNFKITTYRKQNAKSDNENSIITVLNNNKINYLMMGDASMKDLKSIPENIQILKVGHHGAKSVIDTNLLKNLHTETAIISTGTNKFGHPNPLTLSQLKDLKVYRTDMDNSIKIVSNGDKYNVYTFDRDKKKYIKQ